MPLLLRRLGGQLGAVPETRRGEEIEGHRNYSNAEAKTTDTAKINTSNCIILIKLTLVGAHYEFFWYRGKESSVSTGWGLPLLSSPQFGI